MDKLEPIGPNLGRVFNSGTGCVCAVNLQCYEAKLPSLKLKTRTEQTLGHLLYDIALLDYDEPCCMYNKTFHGLTGVLNI